MPVRRLLSWFLAALVLAAVPSIARTVVAPASADGVADEADLQFQLGAEAYAAADFRTALEHFLASNRLVANRNVMFNIARAYEQLGRFPDAYRYYVDALRGEADPAIKREVEAAIARVSPRVGVVEIASTPPGATVYLNRKDLGSVGTTPARLGLAPGAYTVIVELAGYHPTTLGPYEVKIGTRTPVSADLRLIVGTLELSGLDGTEVRIDDDSGAAACVTPCKLDVPPGPHVLFFRRAGFRGAPRTVTVVARETLAVTASLAAETGSILVSTDEPNALVEVDGRAVDFAPTVATGIPVGRHTVRVSLRGFEPVVREVEVKVDERVELKDLSLEPLRQVSAASRETQRIEDAPASVTVIEGQELDAFGYPTILEALRGVRGFASNFDSIYGNVAVRGLGQANDYNNKLLLLSDGAVLNENVLYQAFIHYDGRTDLGDVERIEIVRGPASVLYGTGAVSGVVNLVMRGTDQPTGVQAQASTYENGVARVRVGGNLRQGDVGVWASLAMARSGGRVVDIETVDGSQAIHDFDRFYGWTATGKAWWKKVTLQSFFTWRRQVAPTGAFGAVVDDPRNFGDDRRFLTELKYEDDLSPTAKVTLRGYLNWAYYHQDAIFAIEEDLPTPAFDQNYQETYRSWWAGAEARLALKLGPKVRLTIGGEATFHTKVQMKTGQYTFDGMWEPVLSVNAPYQVVAGFALADWKPSDKVAVQAGARFDYWNIGGNNLALPGEDNVVTSFPALSPRVAIITKPTPKDVVKLMGGTAFRAPSAFEYYYADGGSTQAASSVCGETLKPENIYSAELEGSHRFTRDWVGLASAHATYARNIVESIPVPETGCNITLDPGVEAPVYYRNSAVPQRVLGVDVELRREWRAGMMVTAFYGLSNPRYTQDPDPAITDRALPNAPAQYVGFKGAVPIVPNLATGALRVSFEDRRRVDPAGTERTDRAWIADAVVSGYVGQYGVRYAAGVYNLFNWQYRLPASPYATDLMPQGGRSFILSLGYQR
ncbi:MAG: TonB-dependent receptor [Kofleriaceae bacterium]